MIRSVLVPLDGSPFAEHALPLTLAVARRANASLRLVYVHTPLAEVYPVEYPLTDDGLDCEIKTRQRVYLENAVRRIAGFSPVSAAFTIREGPIVTAIQQEANAVQADLVVMTTHGRGPLARFWLGSVADALVREMSVPLLLVRPTLGKADWSKEPPLKHLLVPLDGSHLAERILDPAFAFGSIFGAAYTLLRVVEPVMPSAGSVETAFGPGVEAVLEGQRKLEARFRAEAEHYLEGVAQKLRSRSATVEHRVVVEQHPVTAILQDAVPPHVDAIALATHGRRGVARLVLGSVADKVIRGSHVPVLVYRPLEA
jgi:nucleotide-binding universal stress UspA family protein